MQDYVVENKFKKIIIPRLPTNVRVSFYEDGSNLILNIDNFIHVDVEGGGITDEVVALKIKSGIKSAENNGFKATMAIIINRRPKLKQIKQDRLDGILKKMIFSGEIKQIETNRGVVHYAVSGD